MPSIYSSARVTLDLSLVSRQHSGMISSFVRALVSTLRTHRDLALENLALRQQLAVLRGSVKRPALSNLDRRFWGLLSRIWKDWKLALVLVKPETVIRQLGPSPAYGGRSGGMMTQVPPNLQSRQFPLPLCV